MYLYIVYSSSVLEGGVLFVIFTICVGAHLRKIKFSSTKMFLPCCYLLLLGHVQVLKGLEAAKFGC